VLPRSVLLHNYLIDVYAINRLFFFLLLNFSFIVRVTFQWCIGFVILTCVICVVYVMSDERGTRGKESH